MSDKTKILRAINSEALKLPKGERNRFRRAAAQTAQVEANWTNPDGGDQNSVNWRQERASIYGGDTSIKNSMRRFRQEYEQHADPGEKSYDIAAQVQRPREDLRGRYREEAASSAKVLTSSGQTSGRQVRLRGGSPGSPGKLNPGNAPQFTPGTTTVDDGAALLSAFGQRGGSLLRRYSAAVDSGAFTTVTPAIQTDGESPSYKPGSVAKRGREVRSPGDAAGGSSSDADKALSWAGKHVGFKEQGANSGGIASYLNKQFGFNGAPWCAMFTSAAVTKGGAPASARSASVAAIAGKVQAGNQGYQRGFIPPRSAKKGDLILWGTRHIGLVAGVSGGKLTLVAGNDSDGVQKRSIPVSTGGIRIARPLYGRG